MCSVAFLCDLMTPNIKALLRTVLRPWSKPMRTRARDTRTQMEQANGLLLSLQTIDMFLFLQPTSVSAKGCSDGVVKMENRTQHRIINMEERPEESFIWEM